jgi:CRP-like cAMP-binding protein
MLGVMNSFPLTTTLVADTDMTLVFTFEADAMMQYLDSNPLLLLGLLKSVVII